jgi:hypothetical protein
LSSSLVEVEKKVTEMIFTFRNEKVMVDRDLAQLYGVETKRFNEKIKRNSSRFEGYIFQLNNDEKGQLVADCDRFKTLKHSSSNPYVFNEHGVLMVASVLNSPVAIEINRKIIKVFVELRKSISESPDYALLKAQIRRIESEQETIKITQKIDNKLVSDKVHKLSQEVHKMCKILDEFQDNNLIIKRPEEGPLNG